MTFVIFHFGDWDSPPFSTLLPPMSVHPIPSFLLLQAFFCFLLISTLPLLKFLLPVLSPHLSFHLISSSHSLFPTHCLLYCFPSYLVTYTRLYMRVCPSVGPRSIGLSVGPSVTFFLSNRGIQTWNSSQKPI